MKRFAVVAMTFLLQPVFAIEIPLESLTPVRIGYIDLQKIFDTYPEKSFAEGDLLKEIAKRRTELSRRQSEINILRQQIDVDETALREARAGKPTHVPTLISTQDSLPPPVETIPSPTSEPAVSTGTASNEPYPSDDPLLGLPGHEPYRPPPEASQPATPKKIIPHTTAGLPSKPLLVSSPMLDLLAGATAPMTLNADAIAALQKRDDDNRKTLDRAVFQFKDYRSRALDDMKALHTQKTYDVMSKIYAVLQGLARDESVTVVLDKSYVLYGEDTVDLSDKLISRLQASSQQQP